MFFLVSLFCLPSSIAVFNLSITDLHTTQIHRYFSVSHLYVSISFPRKWPLLFLNLREWILTATCSGNNTTQAFHQAQCCFQSHSSSDRWDLLREVSRFSIGIKYVVRSSDWYHYKNKTIQYITNSSYT